MGVMFFLNKWFNGDGSCVYVVLCVLLDGDDCCIVKLRKFDCRGVDDVEV